MRRREALAELAEIPMTKHAHETARAVVRGLREAGTPIQSVSAVSRFAYIHAPGLVVEVDAESHGGS